jgi:hypothetical protein
VFVPNRETGTYAKKWKGMGDWGLGMSAERHGPYVSEGCFSHWRPDWYASAVCPRTPVVAETSAKIKHDYECVRELVACSSRDIPGKTASERIEREKICALVYLFLLPCSQCDTHCDSCVRGKQSRPPFPESTSSPTRILHRIHAGHCWRTCQLREWAVSADSSH